MIRALFVSVLLGQALCCGRGVEPIGPRSSVALFQRESPYAGDVVLALNGSAGAGPEAVRLQDALARVGGVVRVEVEPVRPVARVWLGDATHAPVAELCRVAAEVGRPAVPAVCTKLPFGEAGEKGRVEQVGRTLAAVPGVVALEVESEREDGIARVWHRPDVTQRGLADALRAALLPLH